jgi:hypothetical protein
MVWKKRSLDKCRGSRKVDKTMGVKIVSKKVPDWLDVNPIRVIEKGEETSGRR